MSTPARNKARSVRALCGFRGRYHGFELVSQLAKRGRLSTFVSSYTKAQLRKSNLNGYLVSTHPWIEVSVRLTQRIPVPQLADSLVHQTRDHFSRVVCKQIALNESANSFVGFQSVGWRTMIAAKEKGLVSFLDRGAAHPRVQNRLLEREYREAGQKFLGASEAQLKAFDREIAEADYILVPSTFVAESFLSEGVDSSKILVVPLGVDTEFFSGSKVSHEGTRIVQVGAVSLQKGVRHLVDAFKRVRDQSTELWLVGPVTSDAKEFLAREGHPNIKIWGKQSRRNVLRLLLAADIQVHASIQDGFSMAVLEGASVGLPLILTENVGSRDFINAGVDGLVVKAGDSLALADGLDALLADPDKSDEMGRLLCQKIRMDYSWSRYGDRLVDAMEDGSK